MSDYIHMVLCDTLKQLQFEIDDDTAKVDEQLTKRQKRKSVKKQNQKLIHQVLSSLSANAVTDDQIDILKKMDGFAAKFPEVIVALQLMHCYN